MEYARDLLKVKKKSKFPLFLGIASFAIAIVWIWIKLIYNETIKTFDWVYSILFLLNGVSHTSIGFGYSIERLFGKAFIKIDDRSIKIKMGVFKKEKEIAWSQVKSIEYKPNNYYITQSDGSTYHFKMTELEYSVIQEIKNTLETIASDGNIPVN